MEIKKINELMNLNEAQLALLESEVVLKINKYNNYLKKVKCIMDLQHYNNSEE